jgi:uncharacterized DUF497 family protein
VRQFTWDGPKRRTNLRKHGLDFNDAHRIFDADGVEVLDRRKDYGEERYVRVSELDGRLLTLVYTEDDAEVVRFISFRPAGAFERKVYNDYLRDRLGSG